VPADHHFVINHSDAIAPVSPDQGVTEWGSFSTVPSLFHLLSLDGFGWTASLSHVWSECQSRLGHVASAHGGKDTARDENLQQQLLNFFIIELLALGDDYSFNSEAVVTPVDCNRLL